MDAPPAVRPIAVLGDTPFAHSLRASAGKAAHDADAVEDAAIVVIDFRDDLNGVATLEAEMDAGRTGTAILAQIACPALRAAVDRNLDRRGDANRPHVFSRSALTAKRLVAACCLSDAAFWRGQDRVHAAIVGWGPLGRACFDAVIAEGFVGDLARPRVTLIVDEPEVVRQEIASSSPEIGTSAEIVVLDGGALASADGIGSSLTEVQRAAPLTAIILTVPFLQALVLAARIKAVWTTIGSSHVGLHLVADQPLPRLAAVEDDATDLGRRIVTTDLSNGSGLVARLARGDDLPRRLHAAYAGRFSGPAARSWDSLPEGLRAANRAAAAHLPLKLRTIGLEPGTDPDPAAVEPHALQALTESLIKPAGEDAVIRRLARLEHERWCAERRRDGWRYDAVRDEGRKCHPDLVPFDDPRLGADEIAKDIAQIRFLLGSVLHPSDTGWAFPLVLAVRRGSPATIGFEAAVALLQGEPWRPLTLVCALHDDAELRQVRSLARFARRWRLVVPEFGPARPCAAAADLLALPSTVIAPLSRPGTSTQPGWIDLDRRAAVEADYQAYLTARATALVTCEGA